ncbi:Mitochondrial distribution and morphology protein 12 [Pestalotiopsis sp. 9143b]|nr:Mitochondrial distribution and morphology protein 12 [Pestalotiopsis sp. 9143b]
MSIDLNWDTLTSGPDGEELAASIRDFIHTKFQAVPLPRFIKSVKVHDFRFGSIPPKVTLKDICDPLPDFYEEMPEADEQDDEESDEDEEDSATAASSSGGRYPPGPDEFVPDAIRAAERRRREEQRRRLGGLSMSAGNSRSASPGPDPLGGFIHTAGLRSAPQTPDVGTPFLGIPGGTANMHYFPSHIATGWPSGTQTPLAAVAGAQHLNGRFDQYYPGGGGSPSSYPGSPTSQGGHTGGTGSHHRNHSQSSSSISVQDFPDSALLREKHSVSTLAPTSASASRPPTRDTNTALAGSAIDDDPDDNEGDEEDDSDEMRKFREPRIEDMQAVFRIKYAGDIKLMLTAEILLDYPMPSFVGIPVKLNITGLSFDGVGVVANIRKRVHFCFLSPEDAVAAVGNDDDDSDDEEEQGQQQEGGGKRRGDSGGDKSQKGRMGGLLQEIKVESEIGQREGIKQSLKNVGKVERFVLEQVRRIFEEEFVYPSFWTFLV